MDFNGQSRALIYLLFLVGISIVFYLFGMLFPSDPYHLGVNNKEVKSVYESSSSDEPIEDIVKEGYDSPSLTAKKMDTAAKNDEVTKEKTVKSTAEEKSNYPKKGTKYFENLWSDYQETVVNTLPAGKARTDVVIRYYKHPKDGNKINAIKPLRFYIHERPIDSVMLPFESNAVYYGDSISTQDLQLTVYSLIEAGFPIKKVALSEYHDNWKAHAIEIGSDTTIMRKKVLSAEEVSSL
ncbi:MAG: hypothetical protein RH948_19320 [Cyclobacteriaceae bacterium]